MPALDYGKVVFPIPPQINKPLGVHTHPYPASALALMQVFLSVFWAELFSRPANAIYANDLSYFVWEVRSIAAEC